MAARILVVEDESIVAMDIKNGLQRLGYAVPAIAYSGEEAVQKAAETHPDLVLMDIRLKGEMDGVEAAEQIRARFDIPVVYLTAYADEHTLQRAKVTAPFGYILKPFEERELHTAIEIALYKHTTERRLKESERWLATTLKSISDAVISTDTKGLVTFMNPLAEALTGWTQEDALGKDVAQVFHVVNEEAHTLTESPATKALREGIVIGLANNHALLIARDGKEIPIDSSAAPIRDDKGNVTGVVLVFRDITERKRAEGALRESEEKLRRILSSSPDAITVTDLNGKIIECNQATLDMHGFSNKEELIGKSAFDLISPKDRQRAAENMEKTLKQDFVKNLEYTLLAKDGREFPAELSASVIQDSTGKPISFVAITKDITERKRLQEQLREYTDQLERLVEERTRELAQSEGRHRSLVETMNEGLIVLDSHNRIAYINPRFVQMFGYAPEELMGREPFLLFVDEQNWPRLEVELEQARKERTSQYELEFIAKHGKHLAVLVSSSPLLDEGGNYLGDLCIITDLSQRKELEQQLVRTERQAAAAQLAAQLAHEINNPIYGIQNCLDLLTDEVDPQSPNRKYLDLARKEIRRVGHLVRQLSDFYRPHEEPLGQVQLNQIIEEVLLMEEKPLRQANIKVELELKPGLPEVSGAGGQLKQLFHNLIINAREAMKGGGVLRVRTQANGEELQVQISDTGCGMTPEVKERIFEPFFTTKASVKGVGLGLSVCHGVVQRHGGTIEVESQPDRGTTFTIRLPLSDRSPLKGREKSQNMIAGK